MIKDGVRNSNSIGRAAEEFAGAQLGDERRTKRLFKIAAAVERDPAISFPKAMRSDAELEAFYRFINNDGFSAAHFAKRLDAVRWCRCNFMMFFLNRPELAPTLLREALGVVVRR